MNRRSFIAAVMCICVACAAMAGCKPQKNLSESVAKARTAVRKTASDAAASPVVATIGNRDIRFAEISASLDSLPVFVRMRYKAPERRLEFLEAYLEYQVVALAASAEGMAKDPVVVDALKRDIAARYMRDNVDLKLRSTDIPEQEVRAWFDSHPWEFSRPAQNRVYRILLRDQAEAAKVAFRARSFVEAATGEPLDVFKEHVARSSVDPAAAGTEGEIGWFPWAGDGPAPVPEAVAAAAEGLGRLFEVSEPVQAEDGWSVLFLAAQRPPVSKDLDQARTEIAGIILDQRRIEARRALAASLMEPLVRDGKVKIDRGLLSELAATDAAARQKHESENLR